MPIDLDYNALLQLLGPIRFCSSADGSVMLDGRIATLADARKAAKRVQSHTNIGECLHCQKTFESEGKHNRLCNVCRQRGDEYWDGPCC